MNSNRPYFLWDYDLTEADVHRLLKEGNQDTKIWLINRILSSARFEDVWKYISLSDLVKFFPHTQMRRSLKDTWSLALRTWGYEIQPDK
ncbi:hypothetical protein HYS82_00120 [Candidatus Amesbacteria bacterium]|nr:hypothetical protein [Candidatus Amesbacteria bacterium]MBI2587459.1 hypothetical protein [Candidatus Amesbacteria bacterium]